MKFKEMLKWSISAWIMTVVAAFATTAYAQPSIDVTGASGGPGDTVSVAVTFTDQAPAATEVIDVRLQFDPAVVENIDLSGCDGATINMITVQCNDPNPGQVNILVFPFPPAVIDSGTIGTIAFDIQASASIGSFPIELIFEEFTGSGSVNITPVPSQSTLGDVVVQAPAGEGFYTSNPPAGTEIDFGGVLVNATTTPDVDLEISNVSPDTALEITTFNPGITAGSADINSSVTPPFTIAAGDSATAQLSCTPTARGGVAGDFEVTHDGGNGPTAVYPWTCAGLAPLVTVTAPTPSPVTVLAQPGGDDASATGTISEAGDEFSSNIENITYSVATAGPTGMGVAPTVTATGPLTVAAGASADYTVTCEADDATAEGTFDFDVTVTWDNSDPAGDTEATVPFQCEVIAALPVYTSVPAVGAELDFGALTNGVESAPIGIDVTNNGEGPSPDSDLQITAADADIGIFSVDFDGSIIAVDDTLTDAVTVTCTPEETGVTTGVLTVNTNDPNEPVDGFTYDLTCEGESDGAFSSDPAPGGTLNLGVVPPENTTAEGFIDFTNNGSIDEITVECTVTDDDGAFTFDPNPIGFTLDPGATESAGFQCTPPAPGSVSAAVSCDIDGDPDIETAEYTVACQGQILSVPTMNRWGLLLMALLVLGIGGLAGRRMMA